MANDFVWLFQGEQRSRVVAEEALAVPSEEADEPVEEMFRWWTGVEEEAHVISKAAAATEVEGSASLHAGVEVKGSARVPPPPRAPHNTHFRWWTGKDCSELKMDAAEAVREVVPGVAAGMCVVSCERGFESCSCVCLHWRVLPLSTRFKLLLRP